MACIHLCFCLNVPCPLLPMQIDLDNYLVEFPESNIAKLAQTGVKYEDFQLPGPTDSFPAIATHVTGSTCAQHGIFYGVNVLPCQRCGVLYSHLPVQSQNQMCICHQRASCMR